MESVEYKAASHLFLPGSILTAVDGQDGPLGPATGWDVTFPRRSGSDGPVPPILTVSIGGSGWTPYHRRNKTHIDRATSQETAVRPEAHT